jgi:hypothetical protein
MTGFRDGETETFPFDWTDGSVWYFIISENYQRLPEEYTSSLSGKVGLIRAIQALLTNKTKFTLCGVWNGKWRTNIFVLDPEKAVIKLKEAQKQARLAE